MRVHKLLVPVFALALVVAGCGSSDDTATAKDDRSTTYPVRVQADNGEVPIANKPQRIVSLSPTATEMLYAIDAGGQVTAVDDQSDYPLDAPRTSLSGFTPNAEAIAQQRPDLVIVSYDAGGIVGQLGKLSIPVLVQSSAKSLDDTYAQLTALGTATSHSDSAAAVVKSIKTQLEDLAGRVPASQRGKTYFHEADSTFYTVGEHSFAGSLYTMAGLRGIAGDAPQLSQEAIVGANPDYVFLGDGSCCQQDLATVKARPGWADVTAVKNGNVVSLDSDVASRWGPRVVDYFRAIVDAENKAASAS
jgi:iron complex transport system substrate-binding protein